MPLPNKFRVVESTFLLTLALLGSDIAHQFNIGMFRLHINSRRALVGCVICILNYAKTKTTTQLLCILRAFVDSEAAMLWMLGYIRKDDEICLCVYLGKALKVNSKISIIPTHSSRNVFFKFPSYFHFTFFLLFFSPIQLILEKQGSMD